MRPWFASALLISCTAEPVPTPEPVVVSDPIERLDLQTGVGDVLVSAHAEDFVQITASVPDDVVTVTPIVAGGILSIQVSCASADAATCDASLDLRVPEAVELTIETASGDIVVVGMGGDADLTTASGSVEVDGFSADTLLVTAGSGLVTGLRLTAEEVVIASSAGPVEVAFEAPPTAVTLDTADGDIAVSLPQADYALDVTSAEGDVSIEGLVDVPGAAASLHAATQRGDVRVVAF